MGLIDDVEAVARQERGPTVDRFDEDVVQALGSRLRGVARARGWPVVVESGTFGRPLFVAALAGSTPDDVDRARRKRNVVERFRRNQAIGREPQREGTTLEGRHGLRPGDRAAHGGPFPVAVEGAGIIGCAAVPGLSQRQDHMAVVPAPCVLQGRDAAAFEIDEAS